MSNLNPIVSIVVVTYNSSKFILETLESARLQTYGNLELIITDDFSEDNTINICEKWLSYNKSRFTNVVLLTSDTNNGIAANFNRGIINTNAKWVKPIAGDDALLSNCIQDNIDYVTKHNEVNVLFSYNKLYQSEFTEEKYLGLCPPNFPDNIISNEIDAATQYRKLLSGDKIPFTPSLFFNKEALFNVGLPDEDLFVEDYQTWLKLTRKGYKLYFMEKETVKYRRHENATNNMLEKFIFQPQYFKTENFRKRYIYPNVHSDIRLSYKYRWIVNQLFRKKFLLKKNKINFVIYYLLNIALNPFMYIIYIKSHFFKQYRDDPSYK